VIGRRQLLFIEQEVFQVIDFLYEFIVFSSLSQIVILQFLQILHHDFFTLTLGHMIWILIPLFYKGVTSRRWIVARWTSSLSIQTLDFSLDCSKVGGSTGCIFAIIVVGQPLSISNKISAFQLLLHYI